MRKQTLLLIATLLPAVAFSQWFTTGQNADLMISGKDFNHTGGPLIFNHPTGLSSDGNNLMVCDRFNNRVLIWNTAPTTWNDEPDLVLGQPDLTSNFPGTSKSELNWPGAVSVSSGGQIAIADSYNHRVLLWNSYPTSSGETADISINLHEISSTWGWPWGVWTDGTKLAVVATQGMSILFWNSFPTSDNQLPDFTISHPEFGTPRQISSDGSTYFFVGDHNSSLTPSGNATYFWNSYPTVSNQPYDFYRNDWLSGHKLSTGELVATGIGIYTWNTMPTTGTYNPDEEIWPNYFSNGDGPSVTEANGRTYMVNYNGNNILVYDNPPSSSSLHPDFAIGVNNYQEHNTLDSIGYVQNPSLTTDGTRLFVGSDFDSDIHIYHHFPSVSGQMPDEVISTSYSNLNPWDIQVYNNKLLAGGQNRLCIWNDAYNMDTIPDVTFTDSIGSAHINRIKGVAMDQDFMYLADQDGKVFLWQGIPSSTDDPFLTIDHGSVSLGRISSNGEYFCVAQETPGAVFIYRVSDLVASNTTPWKTVNTPGMLNQPEEAVVEYNSLAIANKTHSCVLLWNDINLAPDTSAMVIIGQDSNKIKSFPSIAQNRLFWPGSVLFHAGALWVGELKFASRIVKFTSPSTSVEDPTSVGTFSIFPNPCRGVLQLQFPDYLEGEISVYSTGGQKVFSSYLNTNSTSVNLDFLPNGMYVLRTPAGTKKFIMAK